MGLVCYCIIKPNSINIKYKKVVHIKFFKPYYHRLNLEEQTTNSKIEV